MRVLTAAQMREADRRTIEDIGIPSIVLMETAGREVVAAIDRALTGQADRAVAILAGRGNNGGDGFVVARILAQRGTDVRVFLIGARSQVQGDARVNLDILDRLGIRVTAIRSTAAWAAQSKDALGADLVVDALFGTGLSSPLGGLHARVVEDLNAADVPVVSIDLPSGLSADRPEPVGPHVRATLTVTLGGLKYPLVLPPGDGSCGEIVVADIGIPPRVIAGLSGPRVELLQPADMRARLPQRRPDSHKGTYGHVLIVAGSPGKTGAAALAARGALRAGAGLVTVAVPASVQPTVAALGTEFMTLALPDDGAGSPVPGALNALRQTTADVMAIGPGLGTGAGTRALVDGLIRHATIPLVLDADALTVIGSEARALGRPHRPVIVTPHPGEMSRLLAWSTAEVQGDRLGAARTAAARLKACVVLKGHRTLVADVDGAVAINPTGNPGMATGGSGDVLTGMVAAALAQIGNVGAAARLAVYLHGTAGDLAARDLGVLALTAGDIVARIGPASLTLAADPKEAHHA